MTTGGPGWSDAIGYGETLGTGEGWHQVGGVTPQFSSCLLSNPAMCPVSQSGVIARELPPLFSSTDVAEPLLGVVGGGMREAGGGVFPLISSGLWQGAAASALWPFCQRTCHAAR